MHPKNVPYVVLIAILLGALLVSTYVIVDSQEAVGCVAIGTILGTFIGWLMTSGQRDILPTDQLNRALESVRSALDAHMMKHEVQPYDPLSVGTQLTTLTAEITQLNSMLRSRLVKSKKPGTRP